MTYLAAYVKLDGVERINDIPHRPHRTDRNCCRKNSTLPYRPEINLYTAYHATRDESIIQSRRPLQIRPEQPTPSLQNCHDHSLKTAIFFLANSRPI